MAASFLLNFPCSSILLMRKELERQSTGSVRLAEFVTIAKTSRFENHDCERSSHLLEFLILWMGRHIDGQYYGSYLECQQLVISNWINIIIIMWLGLAVCESNLTRIVDPLKKFNLPETSNDMSLVRYRKEIRFYYSLYLHAYLKCSENLMHW